MLFKRNMLTGSLLLLIFSLTFYLNPIWADEAAHHEESEHEHQSPHGGQVVTGKDYHMEFVVENQNTIRAYLYDKDMNPAVKKGKKSLKNSTVSAYLLFSDGTTKRIKNLLPTVFSSQVDLKNADKFDAVITLKSDGKRQNFRFSYSAEHKEREEHEEGEAHHEEHEEEVASHEESESHEHESPHGGQVVTGKDYHIEFVVEDHKTIRAYLYDKDMNPVPVKNRTASAYLLFSDGTTKRIKSLLPTVFTSQADLKDKDKFDAVVTLKSGDQKQNFRFSYSAEHKEHEEGESIDD